MTIMEEIQAPHPRKSVRLPERLKIRGDLGRILRRTGKRSFSSVGNVSPNLALCVGSSTVREEWNSSEIGALSQGFHTQLRHWGGSFLMWVDREITCETLVSSASSFQKLQRQAAAVGMGSQVPGSAAAAILRAVRGKVQLRARVLQPAQSILCMGWHLGTFGRSVALCSSSWLIHKCRTWCGSWVAPAASVLPYWKVKFSCRISILQSLWSPNDCHETFLVFFFVFMTDSSFRDGGSASWFLFYNPKVSFILQINQMIK